MSDSLAKLARRVTAREKQIEAIVQFLRPLLFEHGHLVHRRMENWHTLTVHQLERFGNFSFQLRDGLSMMGGSVLKVWYHPGSSSVDMDHVGPTLEIFSNGHHQVKYFEESQGWQKAIRRVMKDKDKILARMKQREEQDRRRSDEAFEKYERQRALQKAAERLAL